jgi:hypothetical protein
MADDSLSYLVLARWFDGSVDTKLAPWLPYHTHFPPLFPMLLAAVGGAHDFLRAHVAVAAFLALPTAWLSAKGILSETLYMALTLGALLAHDRWIARGTAAERGYVVFAILVALACSTRLAGVTLLGAFIVHEALASARTRRWHPASLLPVVAVVAAMLAWTALRPGGYVYQETGRQVLAMWLDRPGDALQHTLRTLPSGWLSSFHAEGDVAWGIRACTYFTAAVAFAGTVRAAIANRLDAWYVLFTLVLIFLWLFGVENMRRLLYPIVPLMLLHAAELVAALVRRTRVAHASLAVVAICAAPLAASVPATLLIADKARDRGPFVEGSRYSAAEITDYYRVMNLSVARALAAKNAATLGGLEDVRTATPPGARVMWMRPEYVVILGERECVPMYYAWDARTLAAHVRDGGADYMIVAGMSKNDLSMALGDPAVAREHARPYTRPALQLRNPIDGQEEFILLAVDRAALDAYLARGADAGSTTEKSRTSDDTSRRSGGTS